MRVLLVEDNITLASILARALNQLGFACTVEHTVESAIERVGRESPDIVISDLHLGPGNGMQLLEHVARCLPSSTRILISAALELAGVPKAGVLHGQLAKPFRVSELVQLLDVARAS